MLLYKRRYRLRRNAKSHLDEAYTKGDHLLQSTSLENKRKSVMRRNLVRNSRKQRRSYLKL